LCPDGLRGGPTYNTLVIATITLAVVGMQTPTLDPDRLLEIGVKFTDQVLATAPLPPLDVAEFVYTDAPPAYVEIR
jgi:hypothetical protein